ncbi:efflux RND transporter periplasmic adaptor subunit [Sulfurimonas marina]|uniref:Efflux RND transporter periplasmic adaptor subunit n=1 Tax=Sulfurimonas marina TaxID=2590551 RepID=A0A7M1AVG1_9BACT|nr:efflux RND transporter periplasmic adaptor subunit [Sulfurimonas marina]QOP40578.1 efflux RND transporter periplasmic adaptor subunit [Sulfurimonas marina]
MVKIIILSFITIASLFANDLVVVGENPMVKLTKVKQTKSVYLGSYLAQGHLPANASFRIDAPLEGIVEKLYANIYDKVKKGTVLAVIKSPKILELEAEYINLLIEEEYNQNELKRLKPLYEAAVVAKKQYLMAQNISKKYQTQLKFYRNLLLEWGLCENQINTVTKTKKAITEIKIYAPISGKVADLNINPKMYLQRGEHMMSVVDATKTHLEISLPINLAKELKVGAKLYIEEQAVEVESIAAKIDPKTQTIAVHLLSKKEMFVLPQEKKNIKLFWPREAYEIPASSIVDFNEHTSVFVKVKNGYKLVQVTVLSRDISNVYVIAKELDNNSQLAASGAIALKGALEAQGND